MKDHKNVTLQRSDVFARWQELPDVSEENVRALAERAFPLPLEKMAWSHLTKDKQTLVAGLPREKCERLATDRGVRLHLPPFTEGTDFWIKPPPPKRRKVTRVRVLSAVTIALAVGALILNARPEPPRKEPAPKPLIMTVDSALPAFVDVCAHVPGKTHLIGFSYDAGRNKISIKGRSADFAHVSEFVAALSKSNRFLNGAAESSNLIHVGEQPVVEFVIAADVREKWGRGPALATDKLKQGFEARVSNAAKNAGVKRILAIGTPDDQTAQIEWESDPSAVIGLLTALRREKILGDCVQLQVDAALTEPTLVHARGVFKGPDNRLISNEPPTAVRNIFRPLWREQQAPSQASLAAESKKQQDAQRAAQEQADHERALREETQQLQNKKRALETQLQVSGIVNNGREALAFINQKNGGTPLMVHVGDTVQDARVTLIDDKKGEVQLDYQGKFQVNLRLQ